MGDWTPRELRFSNLGLRLMSAAVLIPLAIGGVWLGNWVLAVLCAAGAGIMAWEWSGISGFPRPAAMIAFAVAACLSLPLHTPLLTSGIFAAGFSFLALVAKGGGRARGAAAFGFLYVSLMPAALWLLRDGPWEGRSAALYFMSFVWASDAAAYFTGRGLGGPRLLPSESPNKTWSGAIGAVIACALCGLAAADIERVPFINWVLAGIAISVVAQVGDLFESGLKRRFKVKDSGSLLPGHGGVLDRVDGLGAVSVFAVLLFELVQGLPAQLGLQS
ncbi:MAG: phosphatidate cytidylyltransferase [Hyphomonas sp.]|nr:phosphatidate cytidylyltransferase [Hyphomonas sp.]